VRELLLLSTKARPVDSVGRQSNDTLQRLSPQLIAIGHVMTQHRLFLSSLQPFVQFFGHAFVVSLLSAIFSSRVRALTTGVSLGKYSREVLVTRFLFPQILSDAPNELGVSFSPRSNASAVAVVVAVRSEEETLLLLPQRAGEKRNTCSRRRKRTSLC